jgi:hypothetical protein
VVFDNQILDARLAHFRAQFGIFCNGDATVVEYDDALRLLDFFRDERNLFRFAFDILNVCHLVVSPPCILFGKEKSFRPRTDERMTYKQNDSAVRITSAGLTAVSRCRLSWAIDKPLPEYHMKIRLSTRTSGSSSDNPHGKAGRRPFHTIM